jgi:hypothetical protein
VTGPAEPYVSPKGSKKIQVTCLCDCGTTTIVHIANLLSKHTTSCGCKLHEPAHNRTHGQTRTSLYSIWGGIKDRCYRVNNEAYKNYGGRGITVCDEWLNDFERFAADVGPRPPGATLERKDNNKNYSPDNVAWASRAEQALNKRNNIIVEWQGEKLLLIEAAKRAGVKYEVALYRYHLGWPIDKVLSKATGRWTHPR